VSFIVNTNFVQYPLSSLFWGAISGGILSILGEFVLGFLPPEFYFMVPIVVVLAKINQVYYPQSMGLNMTVQIN
jgi:hypothetical protein